ncbi:type II toxin-antitoxin system RelE/ParE family toxin [Xenorhabdus bovienii]|uniref:type II toxin-antitoxin system RelE/ParE family toxin n=1 Tax=Xenorhabdus bovienii TaxID=40576 RepID=UPI0009B9113B
MCQAWKELKVSLSADNQCLRSGLKGFPIASHIIFFRVVENGITIVRILHQSMDYRRHINE